MKRISRSAPGLAAATAAGIVLAANPMWFTVNTSYGTNGVSAPLAARSYGQAQAVDHGDANHTAYSLVTALPKNTNGYAGPYTIARRSSSGATDATFGANGLATSFWKSSSDRTYKFHGLCIDPLTHNLIVVGDVNSTTTVVERLTPPAANGSAALDATFNSHGTPAGVLRLNGPLGAQQCSVMGDQSIIIAGSDYAAPNRAVIVRLLVDGTPDASFGTGGVVRFMPPNGENWEGGGIAWNSSQTVNPDIVIGGDTYPAGNRALNTAALIALDSCTGTPDAQFNGNGFMSIPTIDANAYGGVFAGAIQSDGSILVGLLGRGSLRVDLVGWSYPVTDSLQWRVPTAPGSVAPPASLTVDGSTANATPVSQSDGSLLISAQTAANQEALFELQGDPSLGFTVGAPATLSCPGTVTVPDVTGLTQAAATTAITAAGLTVGAVTQQPSSTVAAGSVVSESPAAGTQVRSGSAVSLGISTGPGQVAVPNVVGLSEAAATNAITGAGLTVGAVTQQASSTVAAGNVISESPAAGTSVASGAAVDLVVSTGPGQVTVPNVVGETQAAATSAISGVGLTVGTLTQQSSGTVPAGSVISESPAAGTSVAKGSAVNLVVSSGSSSGGQSSGGGGGGGALDSFTLGALIGLLLLGLRRARGTSGRLVKALDSLIMRSNFGYQP